MSEKNAKDIKARIYDILVEQSQHQQRIETLEKHKQEYQQQLQDMQQSEDDDE